MRLHTCTYVHRDIQYIYTCTSGVQCNQASLSLSLLTFSLILCDLIELYIVSIRIQIQIQFKIHAYIQYICISRGQRAGKRGRGGFTLYVHILMANKCSTFLTCFLGRITQGLAIKCSIYDICIDPIDSQDIQRNAFIIMSVCCCFMARLQL